MEITPFRCVAVHLQPVFFIHMQPLVLKAIPLVQMTLYVRVNFTSV